MESEDRITDEPAQDFAPSAQADATEHAEEAYTPAPRRSGISLCLSGGGFRAALFHLGALRRLNEASILSKVDTISSVSGGSILSAHLAASIRPWPEAGTEFPDWEDRVAAPFRAMTERNIRTGAILRRLWPWNWFKSSAGVEGLAARYEKRLTDLKLSQLPDRPRFIFCATDMAFGVNWIFEKARMGDFQAGYASPPPDWPVARAVAASSCFPPVFNPLPISLRPDELAGGAAKNLPDRDDWVASLRLTDGGNYDNMGLEPVWKNHLYILVSDGGGVFEFTGDKGWSKRLMRYTAILGKQAESLRKRWLVSGFMSGSLKGAYWGIGSKVKHYEEEEPLCYSASLVEEVISKIRTDMDAFSEAESAVLENHGYILADAAIRRHLSELADQNNVLKIPHPEWMNEERARKELAKSHKRALLGRW